MYGKHSPDFLNRHNDFSKLDSVVRLQKLLAYPDGFSLAYNAGAIGALIVGQKKPISVQQ